jgi:hypothetical protein
MSQCETFGLFHHPLAKHFSDNSPYGGGGGGFLNNSQGSQSSPGGGGAVSSSISTDCALYIFSTEKRGIPISSSGHNCSDTQSRSNALRGRVDGGRYSNWPGKPPVL